MVTHLHAQMNAFAFAQYAATKPSNWTIGDRVVCAPEIAT
jgi:hypothetical protein